MAAPIESGTLLELVVAGGLFSALAETVRWLLGGRGRKVDQAKIVQGMAIDLLKPLHTELDTAQARMRELSLELESVLGWAIIARALLDSHQITYPPVPDRMSPRLDPPR